MTQKPIAYVLSVKERVMYWLRKAEELEREHRDTWQVEPDSYWLARIMQEVGEFASALVGDHKDPPEWEAAQIISIMRNWLKKRARAKATIARARSPSPDRLGQGGSGQAGEQEG